MIPPSVNLSKSEQNINCLFLTVCEDAANSLSKFPNDQEEFTKLKTQLGNLEAEWRKFLTKYHSMVDQYTILLNDYKKSREKCRVYQEKLRFVTENSENFQRLRQLHDDMKKLQGKCAKSVQVKDSNRSVNLQAIREAKDTLNRMRGIIKNREDSYDMNIKKVHDLTEQISLLEKQNLEMAEMLKLQFPGVKKKDLSRKSLQIKKLSSEATESLIVKSSFQDFGKELYEIKKITSSFTNKRQRKESLFEVGDGSSRRMNLEDSEKREVEILEKIKKEIQKRSDSIQEKIMTLFALCGKLMNLLLGY